MTPVDEKAKVQIIRQGEREEITVKIGLLPSQTTAQSQSSGQGAETSNNRLGVSVVELTDEQRQQFQVEKYGVLVQKVGKGVALESGIQPGDIILRIQNSPVKDVADFNAIVAKLPTDKSIALLIQRNGSPVFLAFKLDK